jgi:hypothetical protein
MHIFLVITSFVLKPHSGRTALDFISMDDHISRFVCLHLRYSELKKTNKLCVTTVNASVYYHIYIYAICTVGDCADGIHIRGGRGGVGRGGGVGDVLPLPNRQSNKRLLVFLRGSSSELVFRSSNNFAFYDVQNVSKMCLF